MSKVINATGISRHPFSVGTRSHPSPDEGVLGVGVTTGLWSHNPSEGHRWSGPVQDVSYRTWRPGLGPTRSSGGKEEWCPSEQSRSSVRPG